MKLVTIYHGVTPADSQLLCSRLLAAQFHPFMPDENSMFNMEGYGLALGLNRIQVPEDEADAVKEFLASSTES